jgi:hypothetical protein
MRRKLVGVVLSGTLLLGAAPLVGTAHADTANDNTTDPVLCFVAAQSIIVEALHEFREGHLTGAGLRSVLLGTSSFLGDCLTPTTGTV